MDAGLLDVITNAFVTALQGGLQTLSAFSLPLLGAFALIAFYTQLAPLVASGSGMAGEALATVLLTMLKFGVFYWIVVNLGPMTTAALDTFFQWGVAPGGSLALGTFRQPSAIIHQGFAIAQPLLTFSSSWVDRLVPTFALTLWGYSFAYWAVVGSFFAVALHLVMVLIEFYLAVMCAAVLFPWGVLSVTAFFTEFSIGWITGGLVRIMVTAAMVGIAQPLFDAMAVKVTPGGDPTFYGGVALALGSGMYAILSWVVPGRAANIAGRGVSLALTASTVLASASGAGRGALMVTSAVRGVSHMMRR